MLCVDCMYSLLCSLSVYDYESAPPPLWLSCVLALVLIPRPRGKLERVKLPSINPVASRSQAVKSVTSDRYMVRCHAAGRGRTGAGQRRGRWTYVVDAAPVAPFHLPHAQPTPLDAMHNHTHAADPACQTCVALPLRLSLPPLLFSSAQRSLLPRPDAAAGPTSGGAWRSGRAASTPAAGGGRT